MDKELISDSTRVYFEGQHQPLLLYGKTPIVSLLFSDW